eukprot:CAMPEP_0183361878 /NCGR_PEP_ID=MMETSP0164_2-20130417/64770_1 /TAXON_ID=221442 /ORGANISM="Coccolithus pelagicus ssp braarudi, Strain PLY182g" /LENGTH=54 /DNA_ID=CAMNT_0025536587 /DNA_START=258 /DNA_END=423 /DNA_ORIENTATION=-
MQASTPLILSAHPSLMPWLLHEGWRSRAGSDALRLSNRQAVLGGGAPARVPGKL